MSQKLAKTISILFNPLILPTLGIILLFNSGTYFSLIPFEAKKILFYLVFAGTFVIPICFLPLYFYLKVATNINMNGRERILPLLITFLCYVFTLYMMRKVPVAFINRFILASAICIFLNLLITFKWQISSHLIGVGGLVGLILTMALRYGANIFYMLIFVVAVFGLVAFARLKLNLHTPSQIYSGFSLGLFVVTLVLFF